MKSHWDYLMDEMVSVVIQCNVQKRLLGVEMDENRFQGRTSLEDGRGLQFGYRCARMALG